MNPATALVLRGASWATAAQVAPVAVNVVMTPYIIRHFGLDRYGVFLLGNALLLLFNSFDGGVGASAVRFSAIYAGADDRAAATRLVSTLFGVVLAVGLALFVLLYALSAELTVLFRVPAPLRAESEFLFRVVAFVLIIYQVRSLFVAQLQARQLFAWQSATSICSYAVYAVGLVLSARHDWGLRGVAWTLLAQTGVAALLVLPRSLTFLDRHEVGFMPLPELRAFLRYCALVQLTGLMGTFTVHADTFLVGRLLSVGAVSLFGTGANFATQLRSVPVNALAPMASTLSHAFGRGGEREAVACFASLQRSWVRATTAWSAVAVGATYFGVLSWLGPQFQRSAEVAVILVLANAVNLWAGALTVFLNAIGRPGVEATYMGLGVALNIALTIPFILWFGLLGTVAATAISTIVASAYISVLARTKYDRSLRSFLSEVPVVPGLVTLVSVVGLEWFVRPLVPRGAAGLLLCGAVAAPGFAVFGLVTMGPRQLLARLRHSGS